MTKGGFSEEQIIGFLKQANAGIPIKELCRKGGFSEATSVADWAVRKRKKAKRPTNKRVPLQIAQCVNEAWSMDFASDSLANSLANSGRIKCLNDQWFETLPQARAAMALWRQDDSENRPHSSCRRVPLAKFAALHRQISADATQPTTDRIL